MPSRMSLACLLSGTLESPNAPDKIASKPFESISRAPGGSVTPVARYFSADQSKLVKDSERWNRCAASSRVWTASLITSGPTPSPGITAIRFKIGASANLEEFRLGDDARVSHLRLVRQAPLLAVNAGEDGRQRAD